MLRACLQTQKREFTVGAGQVEPTAAARKREAKGTTAKLHLHFSHVTDYLFRKIFAVEEVTVKGRVAENLTGAGWNCLFFSVFPTPKEARASPPCPTMMQFSDLLSGLHINRHEMKVNSKYVVLFYHKPKMDKCRCTNVSSMCRSRLAQMGFRKKKKKDYFI